MKKRIVSGLLTLCLLLCLLPTAALAAEYPAVHLTTPIKHTYVYFGTHNGKPVRWLVTSANTAIDGTTPGVTLVSDYALEPIQFDKDGVANPGQNDPTEWQNSDAQAWCREFEKSNFSAVEQAALLGVEKPESPSDGEGPGGGDALTAQDKVFFPSFREFMYIAEDRAFSPDLGGRYEDGTFTFWWLRTKVAGDIAPTRTFGARPACNVKLDNVAFISAAQGGKAGTLGTVSAIRTYDFDDWKPTLYDVERQFAISGPVIRGNTISFHYNGATTGPDEYISIILETGDTITHYGRILQLDGTTNGESGTASFTLPEGVDRNAVTIYAFNEQFNGGEGDTSKRSDYASELIRVEPMEAPATIAVTGVTLDKTALTLQVGETAKLTATVAPSDAENQFVSWSSSQDSVAEISAEGIVTAVKAGTATITVTTQDGNKTATCTVTVKEKQDEPTPSKYKEPDCDGTDCILERDFDDIDIRKWYHLDLEFVYINDIMKGNNNRTFTPEDPITRAQFIQVLYNLAGNPKVSGTTSFSDVKPGDWWYNAVLWAEQNGITNGNGRGQFEPDAKILREQIAVFLYRQENSPKTSGSLSKFTDAAQVDTWAQDAMKWAVEQDILRGYDGKVDPIGNALRCEAAAMIHRWVQ